MPNIDETISNIHAKVRKYRAEVNGYRVDMTNLEKYIAIREEQIEDLLNIVDSLKKED